MDHSAIEELKDSCKDCLLAQLCLVHLNAEDQQRMINSTVQLTYKKNEVILKQNAKSSHIIFLKSGLVKHYYDNVNGKTLILMVKNAPHIIGAANIFNDNMNAFSVAALEDSEACLIDIALFEEMLKKNNDFMISIIHLLSGTFKSSIFNFINLAHKQVIGRIADIILYLSTEIYKSNSFVLPLSRKEIADFAGASQENVINTLSRFNKEGILKVNGKEIEILDLNRLKQISQLA